MANKTTKFVSVEYNNGIYTFISATYISTIKNFLYNKAVDTDRNVPLHKKTGYSFGSLTHS